MTTWRFGLSQKFVLIIVIFLIGLFTTFSFVLLRLNIRSLNNSLNQATKSFTELATSPIGNAFLTYRDSGRIRITQIVQRYSDLNPNITNIFIVDASEQIVYSQHDATEYEIPQDSANSFTPTYHINQRDNIDLVVSPFFEDSGVRRYSVVYKISDESIQQTIDRQIRLIAVFVVVGLLVSIIGMYGLINHHLLDPIKTLSRQAHVIGQGNFDQMIKLESNDEVAELAQVVNQMARSLKDDIRRLQEVDELKSEFLTIVSHNLRTPLAVINEYLENAGNVKTVEEMTVTIHQLKVGAQKLNSFAEDMITIAELESGQPIVARKLVNWADFVREQVHQFNANFAKPNISVVTRITDNGQSVEINKTLVAGALASLLDNAGKFTTDGSITISVPTNNKSARVSIKDTGIGIKPAEQRKLFTKFHRGTNTLVYDYAGTGIGLYSANLIIQAHNGRISVVSQPGHGSTFIVDLPLADQPSVKG